VYKHCVLFLSKETSYLLTYLLTYLLVEIISVFFSTKASNRFGIQAPDTERAKCGASSEYGQSYTHALARVNDAIEGGRLL